VTTIPALNSGLYDGSACAVPTNILSNKHAGMQWSEVRIGWSPHLSENSTAVTWRAPPPPTNHTTRDCGLLKHGLVLPRRIWGPDIRTEISSGVPRTPPPSPPQIPDITKLDAITWLRIVSLIIHSHVTRSIYTIHEKIRRH
jgi:hypothetical protein